MNPTELNTLRRSLWLTREQAGAINGMTERSWRYLENGTRPIPADVQARMRQLDDAANAMADAAWDEYGNLTVTQAAEWRDIEAVLLRYASDADLAAVHPDMAGLPADLHAAAIDRARILLEGEGAGVRIVMFDPAAYAGWIAEQRLQDNAASRAAWAASAADPQPPIGNKASGEWCRLIWCGVSRLFWVSSTDAGSRHAHPDWRTTRQIGGHDHVVEFKLCVTSRPPSHPGPK